MKRLSLFDQRRRRVRTALRAKGGSRPRLSIHRSSQHIYAQVIDDAQGLTLASASTLEKDVRDSTGATKAAAAEVGKRLAARAKAAGVYGGRVRSRRLPFPWPRQGAGRGRP
jgi:large subunit ribosomal protein L18